MTPEENLAIAHKVMGNGWINTWEELEETIKKAFVERARQRGTSKEIATMLADMFVEEEIYLVYPIIRRFFTQH